MAPVKEEVLRLIRGLPEDITLNDIIINLYHKINTDKGYHNFIGKYKITKREMQVHLKDPVRGDLPRDCGGP